MRSPSTSNRAPRRTVDRQRGVALIAAIWWTIIVAALAIGVSRASRTLLAVASNEVEAAQLRAAARAGVDAMALVLAAQSRGVRAPLDAPQGPTAGAQSNDAQRLAAAGPVAVDGRPYAWRFDGVDVVIRVAAERGKYDLNAGDPALLPFVAAAAGAEDPNGVAAAILAQRRLGRDGASISWRLGAAGFAAVEDLAGLPGVTLALYERLAPLVTVYAPQSEPDFVAASPILAAALPMSEDARALLEAERAAVSLDGPPAFAARGPTAPPAAFAISAEAARPAGAAAAAAAIILIEPAAEPPIAVLRRYDRPFAASLAAGVSAENRY